jgi:outer membrane protein assembly factor BamA
LRKYFHFRKRYSFALRFSAGRSDAIDGHRNPVTFKLGGDENWLFFPKINLSNFDNSLEDTYFSSLVAPLRGTNYYDMAGTRFVLGNFEFRFPFVRDITFQWPLPIQLRYINGALFTDVGSAWTNTSSWHPVSTQDGWPMLKDMVAGVGCGIRMNLGIAVVRFDEAWRTDLSKLYGSTTYFSLGAEF